ncbi:MAG: alpha/beta fold hydrolase [Firmicutes bacterium]|nr:alpha/beta fold hydrolase [Bacillota bacterium]
MGRWLVASPPSPAARLRLYCFPYAGAGASVYRDWQGVLGPKVHVASLQLPGRESRWGESPFRRMPALIDAIVRELPVDAALPFAFFGHSMGALIAFELARRLAAEGRPGPVLLFASGCRAPHVPLRRPKMSTLPPEEFWQAVRQMAGGSGEALDDPELFELLAPVLRADFELCDTYEFVPEPPLGCPVSAFGALNDPVVSLDEVEAWGSLAAVGFKLRLFPGGHLFVNEQREAVLQAVAGDLAERC